MYFLARLFLSVTISLLAAAALADTNDLVLGFGGETDSSGSRAAAAFGEIGVSGNSWVSLTVAGTRGSDDGLRTVYADAGVDYWFEPMGIRLGGGYWGDENLLDSHDLRASLYFKNDTVTVSADYQRRDFDFTFVSVLLPAPRIFEFVGDGYGLATRIELNDVLALSLNGMSYTYSRNINLQPNIEILRRLSTSRLGLMSSLLDYRVTASIDRTLGQRNLVFGIVRWRTAVDQGIVNSIGVGLLTPMGARSDLEFRLAYDHSEDFGGTMTFSAFFYFFGI
jgi:hypothetical protein